MKAFDQNLQPVASALGFASRIASVHHLVTMTSPPHGIGESAAVISALTARMEAKSLGSEPQVGTVGISCECESKPL